MKTLKLAVAAAVLSASTLAAAVDLGAAQQRAEQGLPPLGVDQPTTVDDSARPTSHQLGEAQQQAETGAGYTPETSHASAAAAPEASAGAAPTFGIGEAQQVAETGEGYATVASAGSRTVQGDHASVRQ